MVSLPQPTTSLQLPTGVPGLDEVLGGGLPEGSCTIIAGGSGTGKTTLAQQITFANAGPRQPAVYFCGPSERPDRLREHQSQLTFFNVDRLDRDIHFVDLDCHFRERDTGRVLDTLAAQVSTRLTGIVVVDIPRSLTPPALWTDIVVFLNACGLTSIVTVDCATLQPDLEGTLALADTVLWLDRSEANHGTARTLRALKVRGQQPQPGAHSMSLTWDGARVFPRWTTPGRRVETRSGTQRLSIGAPGIDRILGGGVLAGGSILVQGSSGTGKSILASQFIADGGHQNRPGLVLLFEERPDRFVTRAESLGLELQRLVTGGLVDVLSFRGRDVSADELIHLVQCAVRDIGAERVVIDSTAGLELLLGGPTDLRDCLWRLLDGLCNAGVSVWLNHDSTAGESLGALVDDVLQLRRVELEGVVEHRLEAVKISCGTRGARVATYDIGRRGLDVVTREDAGAPGGNLVRYRYVGALGAMGD